MVCQRCILKVEEIVLSLGYTLETIQLGQVTISETLTKYQEDALNKLLQFSGLCLIKHKTALIIERIKSTVLENVRNHTQISERNLSVLIANKLNYNYGFLSNKFSHEVGITIEQFTLNHKIEYVKELITYKDLNFSEIANELNYSSVAHLSKQFKKVTGTTLSYFKNKPLQERVNIDSL